MNAMSPGASPGLYARYVLLTLLAVYMVHHLDRVAIHFPEVKIIMAHLGHPFEGGDILRPAIGIAAVVDRVDANEDVGGRQHFSIGQRQRQKHRVARGHVRDGNTSFHLFGAAALRPSRAAELHLHTAPALPRPVRGQRG